MCANCMGGVYEREFVLGCVCLRLFRGTALLEVGGMGERGSGTYVTSGIDDLAIVFCAIVVDSPLEGALNSRVIIFNELALEVLEDEGRFAYAWSCHGEGCIM